MARPPDLDTVKGVAALHCRSLFSAMILTANIGVKTHQLENWLKGKSELPPEAMSNLVEELFHGKASWNEATQSLDDVVKAAEPAT